MMTPQTLLGCVQAVPFRPFCLHVASGRTFEIRHPEMIKILRTAVLVFKVTGDTPAFPDEWETLSLMLIEAVSHLEAPVA